MPQSQDSCVCHAVQRIQSTGDVLLDLTNRNISDYLVKTYPTLIKTRYVSLHVPHTPVADDSMFKFLCYTSCFSALRYPIIENGQQKESKKMFSINPPLHTVIYPGQCCLGAWSLSQSRRLGFSLSQCRRVGYSLSKQRAEVQPITQHKAGVQPITKQKDGVQHRSYVTYMLGLKITSFSGAPYEMFYITVFPFQQDNKRV